MKTCRHCGVACSPYKYGKVLLCETCFGRELRRPCRDVREWFRLGEAAKTRRITIAKFELRNEMR